MSPAFALTSSSAFAYFLSVGALLPVLPLYVKGPLEGGSFSVGVAVGSFSLVAVLVRPVWGRVGDRWGRKVLILGGAGIAAVSVAGYLLASSLAVLLAMRVLNGVGEGAFFVGVASVVNDLAPEERRGEALSLFSLALYGGLTVGPALGETVLGHGGFASVWVLGAAGALAAMLLGLRVPETRPTPAEPAGGPLVHRAGLIPGVVFASSIWGLSGFVAFVPLYARDLGMGGSRFVFATYAAVVLAIRSIGARLPDRLGPRRTAAYSLAGSIAGLLLTALWARPAGLFAGTVLFAVGQALAFPALMTLAVRRAPASERGSVVGTFTAFFDLAHGLGAISLGWVAAAFGYRGSFVAGSLAAAIGMVVLLRPGGRHRDVETI